MVGRVVGDAVFDWSVAIGRVVPSSAGVVSTSVNVVEMSGCVGTSDVGAFASDFFSVVSDS